MIFTTYLPAKRRVAAYEQGLPVELDTDAVIRIVGYYFRFHMVSGLDAPEFADGSCQFGKRIRVLARHSDEHAQRLFDICADGQVVNSSDVDVDPITGMPRVKDNG